MKRRVNNTKQLSDIGKQDVGQVHWDDARVFLAIARTGTLSGAATQLKTGLATISRRIERLEHGLGVPLFSRHQTGYRLTDDGEALVARAEMLEQAGHSFSYGGGGQSEVAGRVRLATAENLANPLIIPSLPNLLDRHPGLGIEIVTDVNSVNLHRRDADLAVRMVRPDRGNVTIRRLGILGFGLYGSKAYVDARRNGSGITDFDNDRFIGWAETQGHLPAAKWIERVLRGRQCALMTTTLTSQIAAASAGVGLAVLPHFLARREGLVCVMDELGADQTIWLAVHSDLAHSRRIRVVSDHLTELFLSLRTALQGN